MKEKELIDLLNSIEPGEMNLNEFSKNSIIKAKVIKEIRYLFGTINRLENKIELLEE